MPSWALPQFSNLTPQDIGLNSFDQIRDLPGFPAQEVGNIISKLMELDRQKADPNQAGFQAGVQGFGDYWNKIVSGDTYVPPAGAQQQQAAQAQQAQQATQEQQPIALVTQQSVSSEGFDFDAELAKLFGGLSSGDQSLEDSQRQYLQNAFRQEDFGENEKRQLALTTAGLEKVSAKRTRLREDALSAVGLRKSGQLGGAHREEAEGLLVAVAQAEVSLRGQAAARGEQRRAGAFDRSQAFIKAIRNRDVEMAKVLLAAQNSELDREFTREQFELQRTLTEANISLNRDKFTEEQRAQMKAEGFTDRQIAIAEEQMLWQRTFDITQQTADIGLAERNQGFVESSFDRQQGLAEEAQADLEAFQSGQLSNEEYQIRETARANERQSLIEEVRNNNDLTISQRTLDIKETLGLGRLALDQTINMDRNQLEREAQQLKRELGFGDQELRRLLGLGDLELRQEMMELEREKFDAFQIRLEREFGLDLNRFALEEMIRTGNLDLAIFDTQQKYDLAREDQRLAWFATTEGLRIQELLGMTELEIRLSLGEGELSVAREGQALEKWMFSQGLSWDRERFYKELEEARKKRKGSFLGGLLKVVVGAGVGFITGGGPAGALMGGAKALLGSGVVDSIISSSGTPGPRGVPNWTPNDPYDTYTTTGTAGATAGGVHGGN